MTGSTVSSVLGALLAPRMAALRGAGNLLRTHARAICRSIVALALLAAQVVQAAPVLFLSVSPAIASAPTTPPSTSAPLRAYVVDSLAGGVSAIDLTTNTVVANVPTGSNPFGIAITPDRSRLYVANYFSNTVTAISTDTNTALATITGIISPYLVAISPDGKSAYVSESNSDLDRVAVIDTGTNTIRGRVQLSAGLGGVIGVAVSANGNRLYVGAHNDVFVIDTATNAIVTRIPAVGLAIYQIALSPDGTRLYAASYYGGILAVIDTATNALIAGITTGATFQDGSGVAVLPNGKKLYATAPTSGRVAVVDALTNMVIKSISVGGFPVGVATNLDGTRVYVPNCGSNSVAIIDTSTDTVVGQIPTPSCPEWIAIANPASIVPPGCSAPLEVEVIRPNSGGNAGSVSPVIQGCGFAPGVSAKLSRTGQPDIVATPVAVDPSGNAITPSFDLNGSLPGVWDLVVTNANGLSVTVSQAFTVTQGGAPKVWVDIVGSPNIGLGRQNTFYIAYGNTGTADAFDVTLLFTVPTSILDTLQLQTPGLLTSAWKPDFEASTGAQTTIPIWLHSVPTGAPQFITFSLKSSSLGPLPMAVQLWQQAPSDFTRTGNPGIAEESSVSSVLANAYDALGSTTPHSLSTTDYAVGLRGWLSNNLGQLSWAPECQIGLASMSSLGTGATSGSQTSVCQAVSQAAVDYMTVDPADPTAATSATLPVIGSASGQSSLNPFPPFFPWQGACSSPFGPRSLFGRSFHSGVDISATFGEPVYAVMPGEVWFAGYSHQLGWNVVIKTSNNLWLRYGHLAGPPRLLPVHTGQIVPQGTGIGWADSSGQSTGVHLHLAVSTTDPTVLPVNFVDPTVVFQGMFALLGGNCTGRLSVGGLLAKGSHSTNVVGSVDPNAKVGPEGSGTQQYVPAATRLVYEITFENLATATAPAQKVTVTDQLDPARVDLSTFSLGPIGFGPNVITPLGQSSLTRDVDLRPAKNLIVRIDAGLNTSTGLVIWTLSSIDPATGLPPTDPTVGFLPPDVSPPGGEGSVLLTVMPKAGISTGMQIANQANVIFDANPPIKTQTWLNTIDDTKPVSRVAALPGSQTSNSFTVQWSGTDVGSGVQDFTIYVAQDGGPFTVWQANTTATSGIFTGTFGSTYGFYSVAHDQVGNVEDAPTSAQASTRVLADTTPPTTTASVAPPPNAAGWNNSNVTVTLNAVDIAAPGQTASGVKQITYSASGAQTIPLTTVAGASGGINITTEGQTTITFFATDIAGNVEAQKTLVVELDKTPPVTVASSNPPASAAGWNNTNVAVTLSGSDSLSGVDHTEYNLDGAGWTAYAGAVAITTEGVHSLQYRSVDKAGDVEIAQQLQVKIDKTAPEFFAQFDTTKKDLLVFGNDAGSGVTAGPVAPSSVTPTSWSPDQDDDTRAKPRPEDDKQNAQLRTYLIPDLSGNVTTLVLKVRTVHHETDQLEAQFVSIQYGIAVPITFARNLEAFDLEFGETSVLRSLQQQVRVGVGKERQTIDADFEARENTTEIEARLQGKHQHLTKPGLDLIQILTSKGQLSIGY